MRNYNIEATLNMQFKENIKCIFYKMSVSQTTYYTVLNT